MKYPYEVIRVPGNQTLNKLQELRARGNGIPVIMGNEETFGRVVENMKYNNSLTVEQLLEAARRIDPAIWFREEQEDVPEDAPISTGEWPEGRESPNNDIIAYLDISTLVPYPETILSVIPASESWMVPCYLRIGNWNAVPSAEVHAALLKYWSNKYGAEVVSVADDVIEMTVERPPATRDGAMGLAREHYTYCPDIVNQGVGSIEMLAATLFNATVWYFWWD
jgi:hypothetical protein